MASYSFLLLGGILEPIYYYTTISADFWNPFITTQRFRHRFSIYLSERGVNFDFGLRVRCILSISISFQLCILMAISIFDFNCEFGFRFRLRVRSRLSFCVLIYILFAISLSVVFSIVTSNAISFVITCSIPF